ncbi:LysM peptidoglycan-binding domain-containing protein [Tissierella sp. MB52-C2]|uniref:LysM peptidoglycan-binding domain-containing protein n=1 Tax=Tissierella sp. MB52-C2 TaxID=3070999 RepID=UPI00280B18BC|nr:LysM peptidoglycan-binding domain-containing protein [Tissierella sp. MB52-C2]WMM24272.1 LysM peptidoglycan-binding domain-containing protein [Tissierella sp. MB52-C2]
MNANQFCPNGMLYTIKAGDTFFRIAQTHGVSLNALIAANPGVDPNRLFIGQVICIPTSGPGPTPGTCPSGTTSYTIRSGDTLFILAQRFNTTVEAIIRANPNINPNNLQVGQIICIPTSTPGPGPTPGACPILRQGSRGADVVRLQQLLISNGFNPGAVDGIFGANTHSAVIAFQRSRGLVADGVVGVNTWTALGVNCNPSTTCPSGTISYTIRPGDTLFMLAQRYNTTVEAIMRVNPGINPNSLQIGQIICIPQ